MPPIAKIDRDDTLSMDETNGVVRKLVRNLRVVGLTNTDYTVLTSALAAAGVPAVGHFLCPGPFPNPNHPLGMINLTDRKIKLISGNTVDVELLYEHFMDGDNQQLSIGNSEPEPFSWPRMYGKHKTSVHQTKTNYEYLTPPPAPAAWSAMVGYIRNDFVSFGGLTYISISQLNVNNQPDESPMNWAVFDVDADRNKVRIPISVSHKFPPDDDNHFGQFKTQTGEITVMQPQRNFTIQGHVFTAAPWAIDDALTGAINKIPFMGAPAYQWMCTEVDFEAMIVEKLYKMKFEFQRNPDTWLPTAVFIDARDGKPPPDLVPEIGYRNIHWHTEIDFVAFFQAVFEQ